jgi:hypothetical protein
MGMLLKKTLMLLTIASLASGCNMLENMDGKPEMTSPCVGAEESPCGPKRPVNQWLQRFAQENAFT